MVRKACVVWCWLVCVVGTLGAAEPVMPPRPPLVGPPGAQPGTPPAVPADIENMTNPSYLFQLASVHLNFGAMDRAEPLLKKALENAKDAALKNQIQSRLSDCWMRKGDLKSAAEAAESALQAAGDSPEAAMLALRLADIYTRNKDNENAEKVLQKLVDSPVKTGPENAQQSWMRMDALRRLLRIWNEKPAKLDGLVAEWEAAVAKDPKNVTALERLAEVWTGVRNQPAKALEVFEKLQAAKPNDQDVTNRLESLYEVNGKSDKALELLNKMLESTPKEQSRHLIFRMAQMQLHAGKKDQAVALVKERLEANAKDAQTAFLVASFYDQAAMPEEAEKALTAGQELARSDYEKLEFRFRLADSALRRKDFTKAEQIAQEAAQMAKDQWAKDRATRLMDSIKMAKTPAPAVVPPGRAPVLPLPAGPAITPPKPPAEVKVPAPAK